MKFGKRMLITLAILVGVAFISGVSILATTTFGTKTDPLITLSYLTNQLKPQIMSDVSADISAAEASIQPAIDAKIDDFKAELDGLSGGETFESAGFTLVTLSNGQTASCGVGTELLLRIGTATATGSTPAMVDSTSGTTLSAGDALEKNHMYMVTIQGNGFTATAGTVKILIRGAYTIS